MEIKQLHLSNVQRAHIASEVFQHLKNVLLVLTALQDLPCPRLARLRITAWQKQSYLQYALPDRFVETDLHRPQPVPMVFIA